VSRPSWTWLLTGLSLTGAGLVAAGHVLAGQAIWIPANAGWAIHGLRTGQRPLAVLFAVYLCLALWGVWRLS